MSVIAILQALETLLRQDFRPTRTLLVSFGHNEEVCLFDL
jgi:acetylornithine deacetylase/succinyl-diaminopimelate desuccinylase-like protein